MYVAQATTVFFCILGNHLDVKIEEFDVTSVSLKKRLFMEFSCNILYTILISIIYSYSDD